MVCYFYLNSYITFFVQSFYCKVLEFSVLVNFIIAGSWITICQYSPREDCYVHRVSAVVNCLIWPGVIDSRS